MTCSRHSLCGVDHAQRFGVLVAGFHSWVLWRRWATSLRASFWHNQGKRKACIINCKKRGKPSIDCSYRESVVLTAVEHWHGEQLDATLLFTILMTEVPASFWKNYTSSNQSTFISRITLRSKILMIIGNQSQDLQAAFFKLTPVWVMNKVKSSAILQVKLQSQPKVGPGETPLYNGAFDATKKVCFMMMQLLARSKAGSTWFPKNWWDSSWKASRPSLATLKQCTVLDAHWHTLFSYITMMNTKLMSRQWRTPCAAPVTSFILLCP